MGVMISDEIGYSYKGRLGKEVPQTNNRLKPTNMSNTTDSTGVAVIEAFIQETYDLSVEDWVTASTTTLLLYSLLLNISQEIEYLWFKPFNLPTFFYFLIRYTPLVDQGLSLAIVLLPASITLNNRRSCDIISYTYNIAQMLGYIGVQGLLFTRAYSFCRGNKIIVPALVFSFLLGLGLGLLEAIAFGGCTVNPNGLLPPCYLIQNPKFTAELSALIEEARFVLSTNIVVILTDCLVFGVCFHNVWETWRLQRNARMRGNGGLVFILLTQIISRFFFTIILAVGVSVIQMTTQNISLANAILSIQHCLSSILLSDFTLELRRCNSAANNISLPTIRSVPDMLQYIHQSIIVQMGMGDSNAGPGDGENIPEVVPPNGVTQSPDPSSPENESENESV